MLLRWANVVLCAAALAACGGSASHTPPTAATGPLASTESATTGSADSGPSAAELQARRETTVVRVVEAYYASLNDDDLASAWTRLSPEVQASMGGFAKWAGGFAQMLRTIASGTDTHATDARHATVGLTVRSVDRDACGDRVAQRFTGTWQLTKRSGRWVAASISMEKEAGRTPVTDTSDCPGAAVAETPDPSPRSGTSDGAGATAGATETTRVCYPAFTLPAVTLPATTLPATTLRAVAIGGHRYPAQHFPAQHFPAQHFRAQHVDGQCFDAPEAFALANTTVRVSGYPSVDPSYSDSLSRKYWSSAGANINVPDPSAPGFGELNAAGFPKNQYVRPYVTRTGRVVSGYWRNSPGDGLPTCRVISC